MSRGIARYPSRRDDRTTKRSAIVLALQLSRSGIRAFRDPRRSCRQRHRIKRGRASEELFTPGRIECRSHRCIYVRRGRLQPIRHGVVVSAHGIATKAKLERHLEYGDVCRSSDRQPSRFRSREPFQERPNDLRPLRSQRIDRRSVARRAAASNRCKATRKCQVSRTRRRKSATAATVRNSAATVRRSAAAIRNTAAAIRNTAAAIRNTAAAIRNTAAAIRNSAAAIRNSAAAIRNSAAAIRHSARSSTEHRRSNTLRRCRRSRRRCPKRADLPEGRAGTRVCRRLLLDTCAR